MAENDVEVHCVFAVSSKRQCVLLHPGVNKLVIHKIATAVIEQDTFPVNNIPVERDADRLPINKGNITHQSSHLLFVSFSAGVILLPNGQSLKTVSFNSIVTLDNFSGWGWDAHVTLVAHRGRVLKELFQVVRGNRIAIGKPRIACFVSSLVPFF